jgi:hypothetical protein
MQRKDSAKLNVGYPGEFHVPSKKASFRLKSGSTFRLNQLTFWSTGKTKVFVNGKLAGDFVYSELSHTLKRLPEMNEINLEIESDELPGLLVETAGVQGSSHKWQWKTENGDWQPVYLFDQNNLGIPPHKLEDPSIILEPVTVSNNLYDFGKELFGFVIIKSRELPNVFVGESPAEALDTANTVLEQSLEMTKTAEGFWISKSAMAFRYLYTRINPDTEVQCKALFYPLSYKGAFACSDSLLNQIWMTSAYTLRLCMHDFMLDGIKRDRLPWTGDLAMSMLSNVFTFGDPELVRRSLVALGRAGIQEKDINGIIDYSLWWIISQDLYQLYFADEKHLTFEWNRIKDALKLLAERCDSSGLLKPEGSWLFIDWVDQKKWTALQVMWWWAQESGAKLAGRKGDFAMETLLRTKAANLKELLLKLVWDSELRYWLPEPGVKDSTRHQNFMAVVSGLASADQFAGINSFLGNDQVKPVGTPYMAGFENMALAQMGNTTQMLDRVKLYWGAMLKLGATSFWEAYDNTQSGNEHLAFYGRPYAKSLCHAWSSGPAAFLPAAIFGIRPVDDGWRTFTIAPDLGYLDWAITCIPTPHGNIIVDVHNRKMTVQIPSGTTMEWRSKKFKGPLSLSEEL